MSVLFAQTDRNQGASIVHIQFSLPPEAKNILPSLTSTVPNQQWKSERRSEVVKKLAKGSQKQFESDVARYIIHSMIPLRSVDDPYFRQIFINLGLGASINAISRRKLGRIVNQLYVDDLLNVKNEFGNRRICLHYCRHLVGKATELFRRLQPIGFLQIWREKSAALACRPFFWDPLLR